MGLYAFKYWYWEGFYSSKRPLPFKARIEILDLVGSMDWWNLTA